MFQLNPLNVKVKDLLRIINGSGHDKGYFLVNKIEEEEIELVSRSTNQKQKIKILVATVEKVAHEDGTETKSNCRSREFNLSKDDDVNYCFNNYWNYRRRPDDLEVIDKASVKKEEDEAVQLAAEKRERLMKLIEEISDANI